MVPRLFHPCGTLGAADPPSRHARPRHRAVAWAPLLLLTRTGAHMTTDDTPPILPPAPSPDGRPHVYVMNSDSDFLALIRALLEDARVQVTLEQLRPNVEVSLDNL